MNEEFRRGHTNLGSATIHIDLLRQEIERMISLAGENLERCYQAVLTSDSALEKPIDETEEACVLYSELLTDFERIGDHVLNIGQAFTKIEANA